MTKKTKLTVNQILQLESEIQGVSSSGEIVLQGILRQPIPQSIKYQLIRLCRVLNQITEDFNKVRDTVVIENGEAQEDGTYKIINPEQLTSELKSLLDIEHDVEHYEFKIEDIETKDNKEFYPMMYTLIDN